MQYKVLLTTSGIGSRLGDITKYTNKSLVTIGNKPTLAHIVERYPENIEFVVTLGYYGSHVKQFLQMAYPDRNFTFVEIGNYDGEGSSLAWSQLCAKEELQCPFIYNACDTIVTEDIPEPSYDWIGGKEGTGSSQYDSFTLGVDGSLHKMYQKGWIESSHIYIGLIGINDYEAYWNELERIYNDDWKNGSLNDFRAIKSLKNKGHKFGVNAFSSWYDIGNVEALREARERWPSSFHVLEKLEESISVVNDKVIKFFSNSEIATNRWKRAQSLGDLVPSLATSSDNFYSYYFAEGKLASNFINPHTMSGLIKWACENLWEPVNVKDTTFQNATWKFYHDKTSQRVQKFLEGRSWGSKDKHQIINGTTVSNIHYLLEKIPWDYLCETKPSQFHGDFILDNIIINDNEDGFTLLDWRQDFGGLVDAGDIYYDLAKMNHNLTVNHEIINRDLFTIKTSGNKVTVDILRKDNLVKCEHAFRQKVKEMGYDLNKVDLLTGVVWVNMAPLHHYPFNEFLFHYGKLKITEVLNRPEISRKIK